MAAPVEDYIALAEDAANLGKRARVNRRGAAGSGARYDHFTTPVSPHSKLGTQFYSTPYQTVKDNASAQDGTTTGFFWLQNPLASGFNLWLRHLLLRPSVIATTAFLTSPRILAERFVYTGGTASGATITPAKRVTGQAAAAFLRTAMTGMTGIALGLGVVTTFVVPPVLTGVGQFDPAVQRWPENRDPFETDGLLLVPGEGVVIYQPDAGTAADTRRFVMDITTDEVEV